MADTLDPTDWDALRREAHRLLDAGFDRLAAARDHPWQPVPDAVRDSYRLADDEGGTGPADLAATLQERMLPYATGNTHPRFFGWVHGTGMAEGFLSEIVATAMNANCGGRDHGMVYVERAVIDWTRRQMGMPEGTSGVLVAGTSQATVIALAAARVRALPDVRTNGQGADRLVAYAGASAHNCAMKAMELLGMGHANLRTIPADADTDDIRAMVMADRDAGATPFALIGTAGSVDFGEYDDLNRLADVARAEGLWFHVDGAFGAWTRIAEAPWRALSDGIERADSIVCDYHKWLHVPYDAGIVLISDEAAHRAAFAARPSYLAGMEKGLAGGDPWFCDYGVDLSRGNRALKVWTAIKAHGTAKLGRAISANCERAAQMGALIEATPGMALARPVISNLVVFTADETRDAKGQSELNTRIAQDLQLAGVAVFSTTTADVGDVPGVTCLRAAITNHRTTAEDVKIAIAAVAEAAG